MVLKRSGLQRICPQLGQAVQNSNCDRECPLTVRTWDTSINMVQTQCRIGPGIYSVEVRAITR